MICLHWLAIVAICFIQTHVHAEGAKDCEMISAEPKGWLHVTSARSGLCNQLFGVLGWMPIADLFSLNLVLGPLYSRLSFRQEFHIVARTAQPMPFSHFFDVEHYRAAAKVNHTKIARILEQHEVEAACGNEYLSSNELVVPKRFWPFTRDQLFELLVSNNVTLPRPQGSVMRLGDDLLTTYQFRAGPRSYVHQQFESIARLNDTLQFVYETIIRALPADYLAVHVRLEHDVIGNHDAERNHTNFDLLVSAYLHRVEAIFAKGHPQTGEHIPHDKRIVYMSTGLFHDYKLEEHYNHTGHFRPNSVIRIFTAAGYTPLWSERVLSLPGSEPKAKEVFLALGAEQKALVDLFVCKHAQGFVGAMGKGGSTFTYLILQWREYELRIPKDEMRAIMSKETSELFSAWGVRRRRMLR